MRRNIKVTQAEIEATDLKKAEEMGMEKVVARAREVFNENIKLAAEIEQLKSDLVFAEVRRETELKRARFIINTTLTELKVNHAKATQVMQLAATMWSNSHKQVR